MKKHLLIFFLMAFSIVAGHALSEPLVVVDIKLDKEQYLPGQSVWFETAITNKSKDTLIIDYGIYLTNFKKEQTVPPIVDSSKIIMDIGSLKTAYRILPESVLIIGPRLWQECRWLKCDYCAVGQYALCCSLDIYSKKDGGRIKGKGIRTYNDIDMSYARPAENDINKICDELRIESKVVAGYDAIYNGDAKPIKSITNVICFNVIEPGEDEKTVLSAIKAYKVKKKDNQANVQEDIKEILAKYPKSVYAPQCLFDYIMETRKNEEQFISAIKQFFNEYSDSKYIIPVSGALSGYYQGLYITYLPVKQALAKWKTEYSKNQNVVNAINKTIAGLKGKLRYN